MPRWYRMLLMPNAGGGKSESCGSDKMKIQLSVYKKKKKHTSVCKYINKIHIKYAI